MMLHNGLFWLLMLGHILGEYYAQSRQLQEKKLTQKRFEVLHLVVYAVIIALSLWPIAFGRGQWSAYLYIWIAMVGSHAVIDWTKDDWMNRYGKESVGRERGAYFISQAAHIVMITVITLVFRMNIGRTLLNAVGEQVRVVFLFHVFDDSFRALSLLQYLFIFLAIGKPAGVFVGMCVPGGQTEPKYVGTVGVLERAAVVLLMFAGQYLAIVLLLAIKVAVVCYVEKEREAIVWAALTTLASFLAAVGIVLFAGPVAPQPELDVLLGLG